MEAGAPKFSKKQPMLTNYKTGSILHCPVVRSAFIEEITMADKKTGEKCATI